MAGHKTIIYDTSLSAIEKTASERLKLFDRLAEKGKLTKEEAKQIEGRISSCSTLEELKNCSVIIEAIVENLDIKKKLFASLDAIVSAECILATNTSSLSVTSIAGSCQKPSRVIGIHFFNPPGLMPLVEIVPGLQTSADIVQSSKSLISSWGKTAVIAKDTPGFIVNRIARPFYGEAIRIYEEGLPGISEGTQGMATIDWAMRELGGFRMGPFELMDLIGNDVNYAVTEAVWTQCFYNPKYVPSITQKRLFEAGRFGKKTGQGYYDYADGSKIPEPMKDVKTGEKIFMRILCMLINEAVDALYYRIASRDDIDLAMTKGVNYPKGLLEWCDQVGPHQVLNQLNDLRNTYAEERYRPSVLLQRMANAREKFYV